MINFFNQEKNCDFCGNELFFNSSKTVEAYKETIDITVFNIFDKIDDIIEKYLVYTCSNCGADYRYTYKELEKSIRKILMEKLFLMIARSGFNTKTINDKVYIYCGKCSGFDGSGICPRTVYNKCQIKRFPSNVL